MILLKYGNTNTFLIRGSEGYLLVDTDYAGTLPVFFKAIKECHVKLQDIQFVMATHYHPDHMGLIGELMRQGVKLLLVDVQAGRVHFSDKIFAKDKLPFVPVREEEATVITCAESRAFLARLGIAGEMIHTPSHSEDSISLIMDDGDCLVGDLEPLEYLAAYEENALLKTDWKHLLAFRPRRIYYAHANAKDMIGIF
ncbi:MAG: MBL fold metallo-hydrolase [Firmicutes bacterium]|nr:MBL fold metallo-hydrolase [Bacillota bacterium]